jgi:hypothetical protein
MLDACRTIGWHETRCFCRAQKTGTAGKSTHIAMPTMPRSKAKHVSHVVTARRLRPCQHARAGWPSMATGESYVHLSFIRIELDTSFFHHDKAYRLGKRSSTASSPAYLSGCYISAQQTRLPEQQNSSPGSEPSPSFFGWALCSSN